MCVSLALSLLAAPGIFDMADHPLAIQLRMGDKAGRVKIFSHFSLQALA